MSSIGSIGMRDPTAMQAAMHAKIFKSADQDASGGLNVDEFRSFAAKGPDGKLPGGASVQDSFKSFDTDGDGSLTQSELDTGMQGLLESSFGSTQAFVGASQAGSATGASEDASTSTSNATNDRDDPRARALHALLQAFASSAGSQSGGTVWSA